MTARVAIRPADLHRVWAVLDASLPVGGKVFVFGSRAKGTLKRGADLDLAVDVGRPLTPSEVGRIADGFEDSDLPYRVDVVDLQSASEAFRMIIARDQIALPNRASTPGAR